MDYYTTNKMSCIRTLNYIVYALLFSVIRFSVCFLLPFPVGKSLFVCLCVRSLCVIAIWSFDYKVVIKPLDLT